MTEICIRCGKEPLYCEDLWCEPCIYDFQEDLNGSTRNSLKGAQEHN